MIKENQRLLNWLNILSDGVIVFAMLPLAFWVRFFVLPGGIITVPLPAYMTLDLVLTLVHLATYGAFGLYGSFRHTRLLKELTRLLLATVLDMALLLSVLFVTHGMNYSRWTLAIFFALAFFALGGKRVVLRQSLRYFRKKGYNQKHILILGSGRMALRYLAAIQAEREMGYICAGYAAAKPAEGWGEIPYLGGLDKLDRLLKRKGLDEVVAALDLGEYERMPQVIAACEKAGVKLAIVPFYAEYTAHPQLDELGNVPLMNIRRIPLDNLVNAFVKRAMDVACSALGLLVTSPLLLVCAIGVKATSPGPVIFKQERVGRNKKPFMMYKFRSMRVNDREDTAWSTREDARRTGFGSFIRKYSLDELPQLWNVLKGDMSLVGPRPELPRFVDQFKEEVPLYMVKHQVRPGITGWAQVNGYRGDTSIQARVEHDIYYIEHWSLSFDLLILLKTVFQGKFVNDEVVGKG